MPQFTTQAPGYCPGSDWITYGSNCYRIERTTRSYGEAKFDCANRDATVLSIASKAEMDFVTKNVDVTTPNQIWLGLVKNPNTGINVYQIVYNCSNKKNYLDRFLSMG